MLQQPPQPQTPPQQQILPTPTDTGSAESKTLWMGAVQPHWDETFLASLFAQTVPGELVSVKVMRNPVSNMPSGYAFLEFASHESAMSILDAYNGQIIPGTAVAFRLNWGAGARKAYGTGVQEYSLFVGDLAPEVTDSMLQETFASRFPACSSAKVVTDSATGSSKGYGFVRFSDRAQSEEALQMMNGVQIGSRAVRVSPATMRRQDRAYHMAQLSQQNHIPSHLQYSMGVDMRGAHTHDLSSRMNGGYRGANLSQTQTMSNAWLNSRSPSSSITSVGDALLHQQQALASSMAAAASDDGMKDYSTSSVTASDVSSMGMSIQSPSENTTVFVGNLDPSVTEEQLEAHFQGLGTIIQIKIPPNRGCGFVKFEARDAAEKAIATMHGSTLAGLRIRLDWGKANASRHHNQMGAVDPSMGGYSAMQAHQYYMAQWQAQQAQAAYYYQYRGQAPQMYVVPQQPMQQQHIPRQQGMFPGLPMMQSQQQQQQPSSQILPVMQGDATADFNSMAQSLTSSQGRGPILAWNDAVQ
jgi:RNA recognition motif-containing protein